MTFTLTNNPIGTKFVQTALTTIYTVPAGHSARIQQAALWNASSNDETVTLWKPEGGAAGASNIIVKDFPIAANSGLEVTVMKGMDLAEGWSIEGQGSTDDVLTLTLSGLLMVDA